MSTPKYSGKNVSAVKAQNIKAILMSLLYREPAFRVDLAKNIAVSTTTVSKLVDELLDQEILTEGVNNIDGNRSIGRPKLALYLKKNAYYAIGIHIGGERFRIGIVNLRNETVRYAKGSYDYLKPWDVLFDEVCEQTQKMIDESGIDSEKIIGIGIGVPGLVDFSEGVIGYSKNHNWHNIPVKKYFHQKLNLPVVVENNVRSMALGEALFGYGRSVDNLLFIYGSRGVGAGLVVNRRIYRGISQGAGEIGHTFLIQHNNGDGKKAERFTLEELISTPAIIKYAKEKCESDPKSEFAVSLLNLNEGDWPDKIMELARNENLHGLEIISSVQQYLGLAVVNAINFINPELILLGGLFADYADLLLPSIRQMADELSFAHIGKKVDIRATKFGWQAGLYGASALALAHFFYLPPDESFDFYG